MPCPCAPPISTWMIKYFWLTERGVYFKMVYFRTDFFLIIFLALALRKTKYFVGSARMFWKWCALLSNNQLRLHVFWEIKRGYGYKTEQMPFDGIWEWRKFEASSAILLSYNSTIDFALVTKHQDGMQKYNNQQSHFTAVVLVLRLSG